MTKEIYYLGAPYSHPDVDVQKNRYRDITLVAGKLILRGYTIFSPLTLSHPYDRAIIKELGITKGQHFWLMYDIPFMDACCSIIAFKAPGWETSKGLKYEVEYFTAAEKPVYWMDESEIDTWEPQP